MKSDFFANSKIASLTTGAVIAVRRYGLIVAMSTFVPAISVSTVLSLYFAQRWEASAVVQLGTVQFSPNHDVQLIEPLPSVLDWLRLAVTQDEILRKAGVLPTNRNYEVYRKAIVVEGLNESDLLAIHASAFSKQDAQSLVMAAVEHVSGAHEKTVEPTVARWRSELDNAKRAISAVEMRIVSSPDHSQMNELHALESRQAVLENQFTSVSLRPTKLLGSIKAADDPVSPRKLYHAVVTAVLGFVAGVTLAYVYAFRKGARGSSAVVGAGSDHSVGIAKRHLGNEDVFRAE